MSKNSGTPPTLPYLIGILGSFLVIGLLAWSIHRYTTPAPLGEDRAKVRAKALQEVRAAEAEGLATAAWLDQGKGVVRLPIEQAMGLAVEQWRNPAAAKSNLVARVEKATALPSKAPEKPSDFE